MKFYYNQSVKLSVIIPVYNEIDNIEKVIKIVEKTKVEKEIIVVDDLSDDGTRELLKRRKGIEVIYHNENLGKGAAIRSALKIASGDFVIIQDADLEYSPEEYPRLLEPLQRNETCIVYGSRFLGKGTFLRKSYYANRFLTLLTNLFFGSHLTDMETCYKVMRTEILKNLRLVSSRFEIEPEITCKVLKKKEKIVEVPITYEGRSKGKKIGVKDGIQAVWTILKWRFKK